jgi:catechol-2,3-dioxygenase
MRFVVHHSGVTRIALNDHRRKEVALMKLNHINLTVTDVPGAHKFLQKYFGMRDMGGNNNIAFLSDDNGMVLSLTSMKLGGEGEVKYPATFHIGFGQESKEQVNEINQRLKDDGFDVPPPSR